uniref:flavin-containing monooxygenase 5-like isoform X1 n=2 Tax=Styela clava TaxID=7725 RepID=UPI00193AADFE|nr:flavin-containing monooxygenase 5-like isoform X1 [Styela clava]
MDSLPKKIAIIGAGCSGLAAIKCCLDEGLEPACFDKDHEIGGLWRYEEGERDAATVYQTTVINSSKETLAFSDFPIPKEYPNFMHHTKVMEYFNLYAEKFYLRKYISLNTEVVNCCPTADFKETGKWQLILKKVLDGGTENRIFDGVMVCVGHHAVPYYPLHDFPGVEKFQGKKMHSRSYRTSTPFEGKRVTVVGMGNSGCDMAVELSRNAKQVYLSTRRGTWLFSRIMDKGVPFDFLLITRFTSWLMLNLPSLMNPLFESILNTRFDHEKYGVKPKHRVLSQHPTISDELPHRIVNGTVILKPNVTEFTENEVIFKDGTREKIDAVIFATGFSFEFPFLDRNIIDTTSNQSGLYRLVWPMNLEQNTLAVIGLVQPLTVIGPCSEIQSRWAAKVFKGGLKLPSNELMKVNYDEMMTEMKKRYLCSHRYTIEVDGVTYMDRIAEELSCKPNLFKLFITDPLLAWEVLFGPFTCVQYRLTGPGKWEGARKIIMAHWGRMWFPLSGKEEKQRQSFWMNMLIIAFAFCAIAWII